MITYSKHLVDNGDSQAVSDQIWPVIQNDLAYVAQYWNNSGVDLWEEVRGSSFFTVAAQHRALVEGSSFAKSIDKSCDGCEVAPQLLCFLQDFWNGEHIVSNINTDTQRSGKDANSVLTSLHTFDPAAKACDDSTFQPCSSRALSNLKVFVDSFRDLYAINQGIGSTDAVALGRYPEDVYFTGNPWYLCTTAAAEQLYDALYQWDQIGSITVDDLNHAFFQDLDSGIATGSYDSSSDEYKSLTSAVQSYADGFMSVAQKYTPEDGSLSEQFSKANGTALSARDLTWSYAAFLTALSRRKGEVPGSWGENDNNTPPTSCSGATASGTYSSATVTSLPGGTSSATPTADCSIYRINFNVIATTKPGQNLYLVGNSSNLGNWSPGSGASMSATNYTDDNHLWFVPVHLEPGQVIAYKYVRSESDGSFSWESDPDRTYTVPAATATVHDTWK